MRIKKPIEINSKKIVNDGCMITHSGEIINLLQPDKNKYIAEDIAHGLAFTCRWNGATKTYFSVAEHSCRMYDVYFQNNMLELARTALFHDAEEAYWGDIIKPLKNLLPHYLKEAMIETRRIIFNKFDIMPICSEIDKMDFEMLLWDFEILIVNNCHTGWDCYRAEKEWMQRYNSIMKLME